MEGGEPEKTEDYYYKELYLVWGGRDKGSLRSQLLQQPPKGTLGDASGTGGTVSAVQ